MGEMRVRPLWKSQTCAESLPGNPAEN